MADEPKKEPVKIEELSAYSLYQVQRSLNEYNKWEKEREGERGGMNGEEVAATAFGNYDWDESGKRQSYRKGKSYDIEDEYRYLMAEQDFVGEGNANFAAEEEAEYLSKAELEKKIRDTRKMMEKAAKELDFIEAARLRDQIKMMQEKVKNA